MQFQILSVLENYFRLDKNTAVGTTAAEGLWIPVASTALPSAIQFSSTELALPSMNDAVSTF